MTDLDGVITGDAVLGPEGSYFSFRAGGLLFLLPLGEKRKEEKARKTTVLGLGPKMV